jgi:hypothetical protein
MVPKIAGVDLWWILLFATKRGHHIACQKDKAQTVKTYVMVLNKLNTGKTTQFCDIILLG